MYKIIKKSRAIQSVIILFALFLLISIYPVRMWHETIPSVSSQILSGSSDSAGQQDYLLQRFIAQYNHMGTINLYLADFENGWDRDVPVNTFLFRMLDSNMEILFEEEVDTRFVDMPGFCPVYINEDLVVGKDYYFFLQGVNGSRAWFGVEETANAGTPYVSRLLYNYDEVAGHNIIAEYNYSVPLRKNKVFVYDAILLVITVLLAGAVELYYRKTGRDRLITVARVVQVTANLLTAVLTAVSLYLITIRQYFSGQLTDNIFYTAGALLCSGLLFYIINKKRDRGRYVPFSEKIKNSWTDWLQSAFFAGAIWACCNYMNGLYEIHHRIAERQLLLFLALAVITMFRKKELFHIATAVYAVIAAVAGIWYRSIYADPIAMDKTDMQIFNYEIWIVLLAGFIVMNLLLQLAKRRRMSRFSIWYGMAVGTFFVLIIVFRNTRWWTVALAVSFTLFYLSYAFWDKRGHLLQNICNGLLLNFVCAMVFSLLHRPFLSWVYPRFPFIFHTVTVTAVYMSFVMCAALVKLVDKYRRSHRIPELWPELLLLGLSSSYMVFTASRTGFLAVAVMVLVTVFMTAEGRSLDKWKNILGVLWRMAAALILCLPVVFTAQRILPAVNNDVFKYEVEEFPDAVTRGNEWDSMYYITVGRFVEVFNNKIFGIPEKGSTSYERSEEYQKYRARRYNSKGEVVWEGSIQDMYAEEGDSSADSAKGEKDRKLSIIGNKTEEERAADDALAEQMKKAAAASDQDVEEEDSAQQEADDKSVYEATEEYANGRLDIFRAYLEQLNLTGHDDMGALLPDGTMGVHAHNIYIQVAYDHGIIVGIIFILVGAGTFLQGWIFYKRKKEKTACAALPVAAVLAFAMAGLVEWIFHLCHPAGFTLLLVIAPLLFDMGNKKDKTDEE